MARTHMPSTDALSRRHREALHDHVDRVMVDIPDNWQERHGSGLMSPAGRRRRLREAIAVVRAAEALGLVVRRRDEPAPVMSGARRAGLVAYHLARNVLFRARALFFVLFAAHDRAVLDQVQAMFAWYRASDLLAKRCKCGHHTDRNVTHREKYPCIKRDRW